MLMRILAISGLTLRAAIRSRVFVLLIAMVVICIAGLPFVIKSDGTAAGQAQLFIHYAFGLTMTLLAIAAAWSAAGAIALEVAGRQMHMLVTKPAHTAEIWFGKWLGLMTINLVLLGLAGGLIYGFLRWTTRNAVLSADDQMRLREEVLTAHSLITPEQSPAPPVPSGVGRTMFAVPPAGTQSWVFRIPERVRPGDALFLRFQFAASRIERQMPVTGLWLIGADDSAKFHRVLGSYTPHVGHTLKLPPAVPGRRLTITYKNVETAEPATVLFAADTGAQLLIRESGFESNFIRALLLVLARLAFFTALGLTVGALFSFPVAVFTAFAFLFITGLSGWIGAEALMAEADLAPAWLAGLLNAVTYGIIQLAHFITPPLTRFEPLNFLPLGAFIPWTLVGTAWGILALGYGGALAVAGIWIFSRREMGLAAV
ncbi:MAG: ABC transporter permease subunit [Verrucomicrobiota bacterium]